MTADMLREAASLMRERAEAATAPKHPWAVDDEEDRTAVRARRGAGPTVVVTVPLGYHERRANAEHIASWHPAVALAVADLLDELLRSLSVFGEPADDDPLWRKPTASAALAVARAYLGRDA